MIAARLNDLLILVGAADRDAFLLQLVADLSAARAGLGPALAAGDCAAVRRQTHVLAALAGTIGAADLHAAARTLHAANGSDEADPDATLHHLDALLADLATLPGRASP